MVGEPQRVVASGLRRPGRARRRSRTSAATPPPPSSRTAAAPARFASRAEATGCRRSLSRAGVRAEHLRGSATRGAGRARRGVRAVAARRARRPRPPPVGVHARRSRHARRRDRGERAGEDRRRARRPLRARRRAPTPRRDRRRAVRRARRGPRGGRRRRDRVRRVDRARPRGARSSSTTTRTRSVARFPSCDAPRSAPASPTSARWPRTRGSARWPSARDRCSSRSTAGSTPTTCRSRASIARAIREVDGGLPGVRALGLLLESEDRVQVSMNLVDLPVHRARGRVRGGPAARRSRRLRRHPGGARRPAPGGRARAVQLLRESSSHWSGAHARRPTIESRRVALSRRRAVRAPWRRWRHVAGRPAAVSADCAWIRRPETSCTGVRGARRAPISPRRSSARAAAHPAALPLGEPAPDAELLAVGERVLEAVDPAPRSSGRRPWPPGSRHPARGRRGRDRPPGSWPAPASAARRPRGAPRRRLRGCWTIGLGVIPVIPVTP